MAEKEVQGHEGDTQDRYGFKFPVNSHVTHVSCKGERKLPKFFVLKRILEEGPDGVTRHYEVRYCGPDGWGQIFNNGKTNVHLLTEAELEKYPEPERPRKDLISEKDLDEPDDYEHDEFPPHDLGQAMMSSQ
jgi:hypothetical protein